MDLSIFDTQMPPLAAPQETVPSWQEMADERRARIPSASGDSLIQRGIDNVGDRRGRQENHPMSMFDKLDLDLPSVNDNPIRTPLSNSLNPNLLSNIETLRSDEAGPTQMPGVIALVLEYEGYHKILPEPHTYLAISTAKEILLNHWLLAPGGSQIHKDNCQRLKLCQ